MEVEGMAAGIGKIAVIIEAAAIRSPGDAGGIDVSDLFLWLDRSVFRLPQLPTVEIAAGVVGHGGVPLPSQPRPRLGWRLRCGEGSAELLQAPCQPLTDWPVYMAAQPGVGLPILGGDPRLVCWLCCGKGV